MSPSIHRRLADLIKELAEDYRSKGYAVEIEPLIVTETGTVRPDIIARRADETVLIEVKAKAAENTGPLDQYASLAAKNGWRFVVVVPGTSKIELEEAEAATAEEIKERLAETRALNPRSAAASLLAWAVLEAAARYVLARAGQPTTAPIPPHRLVQQLAARGFVAPDEESYLLEFAATRNRLAHGFRTSPNQYDVSRVLSVAERLTSENAA